MEKVSKAKHVMKTLKEMIVGDIVSFPIEWVDTVRVQSCKCNLLYGGSRSTSINRESRLISVERTK